MCSGPVEATTDSLFAEFRGFTEGKRSNHVD